MINIFNGYRLTEYLSETTYSDLYRGVSPDQQAVIVKLLKKEQASPARLAAFKQEYEVTAKLAGLPGVVQVLSLEESAAHQWGMIFKDGGGRSLADLGISGYLSPPVFLNLAIQITTALEQVHRANLIHKDLNPNNIIFNQEENQIELVDFGSANELGQELVETHDVTQLEGTLAYMAPEQTGRINRPVDYRADLYALGVTFYELLSGISPFVEHTQSTMEIIYRHLTLIPTRLERLNPEIPSILSDIVMRLLAKDADDRYQSASGVLADLQTCQHNWEQTGAISSFELGQHDLSYRFQIPAKLYGRETLLEQMQAAFERIQQGGREVLVVSGEPGIGKTALVREGRAWAAKHLGYYVESKYEQLQRDIPYSALVQAYRTLIKQFLAEGEASIDIWQARLQSALGNIGQVVIELIPELQLIVGTQAPIPNLPPSETQNRFNIAMQDFTSALATPDRPLMLFIDDLQWADLSSLKLMEALLNDHRLNGILIVLAYRDNEVDTGHPFNAFLASLRASNLTITELAVTPLGLDPLRQMLVETLKTKANQVSELAQLIQEKTAGNPFFVQQFLLELARQKHIFFKHNGWAWDTKAIEQLEVMQNVVELVRQKMATLPTETQQVLGVAGVIGGTFNLQTLEKILQRSATTLTRQLWPALTEHIVQPIGTTYKFALAEVPGYNRNAEVNFRFVHDRVQQAAYETLSPTEREELHWQIGWLLWGETPITDLGIGIFEIADHLNAGRAKLQSTTKHKRLCQINQMAAEQAIKSAAYSVALNYYLIALGLLDDRMWQEKYDLALYLHEQIAAAAYVSGELDIMHHHLNQVFDHAHTILDKINAYETFLNYLGVTDGPRCIEVGLAVYRELGLDIPDKVDIEMAIAEHIAVHEEIKDLPIETYYNLPEIEDLRVKAIIQLCLPLIGIMYLHSNPHMILMAARVIKLNLESGKCPEFTYFLQIHAFMRTAFSDLAGVKHFGYLSHELLYHWTTSSRVIPYLEFTFQSIRQWFEPETEISANFYRGYVQAREIGDLNYRGFNASNWVLMTMMTSTKSFDEIKEGIRQIYSTEMRNLLVVNLNDVTHAFVQILQTGDTIQWARLREYSQLMDASGASGVINLLIAEYLLSTPQQETLNQAQTLIPNLVGVVHVKIHNFYNSLSHFRLYPEATPEEQATYLERIGENQSKMALYMHYAPMNIMHRYHLVEAERCRILGENAEAAKHYDIALEAARENKFIGEEAIICEQAAEFYFARGRERLATVFIQDAHYAYLQWGAYAKVTQLENRYPHIFTQKTIRHTPTTDSVHSITATPNAIANLDLESIVKVFQTISTEIDFASLLRQVMQLTITNAGAQEAALLLQEDDTLLVEAVLLDRPDDNILILNHLPLNQATDLPFSPEIVQYTAKTHEVLILDKAVVSPIFGNTPYIQAKQSLSILCVPLINQGKLTGIIYLENSRVQGAFTPERVDTIRLLSAQMSISLKNALLYDDLRRYRDELEERVANRTRDLEMAARVARQLTTLMDFDALIQQITEQTRQAYNLYHVSVFVLNPENGLIEFKHGSGSIGEEMRRLGWRFNLDERDVVPTAARTQQPILLNNIQNHANHTENPLLSLTQSELALPMIFSDKLIGVLDLQAEEPDRFTQPDLKILTSLADQLAIAIENAQLYSQQEQLARHLQQVDQMKSQFLASMSHELRTPLNAILNFAEFMSLEMLGDINDEQHDALKSIYDSGAHLLSLINDVLDIAKIEAGMMELFLEDNLNVYEDLEVVQASAQALLKDKPVKFFEDIDPNLPRFTYDRRRVRQVILNLLSNAAKFTQVGSITLSIKQLDTELMFLVGDTGPGIPLEQQSQIFKPFQQTEAGIRHGGGTGLGLAISKSIVETHGGKIWFESELNVGTCFYFTIPLKFDTSPITSTSI